MPVQVTPYVPRTITVHLGPPDEWAENVTVSFPDYVKNVASSEIYPTWEPAAIQANILAITSFALNRVYTEFYPSRGYDFQITSTTAYDQKFIRDRNIFENISRTVDEMFTDYIRREGFVEPLAAKFCNGTTSTCAGLSQWGSQELPSRATAPWRSCGTTTGTTSSWWKTPRSSPWASPTRAIPCGWAPPGRMW